MIVSLRLDFITWNFKHELALTFGVECPVTNRFCHVTPPPVMDSLADRYGRATNLSFKILLDQNLTSALASALVGIPLTNTLPSFHTLGLTPKMIRFGRINHGVNC